MSQSAQAKASAAPLILPFEITKGELARYFGCHVNTLWRRYLTKERLQSWGFVYQQDVKPSYRLNWQLTRQIFTFYDINAYTWHVRVNPHLVEGGHSSFSSPSTSHQPSP
jgi:hypothetical protein